MTPAWADRAACPFAQRRVDVEGVGVSDVDEGAGPTVLMVRGAESAALVRRVLEGARRTA